MKRTRAAFGLLVALLAAAAVLLGSAAPAMADDGDEISDAIDHLSGNATLYVGMSGVTVNTGTVSASLNPTRKIAVIDVSDPDAAAVRIAQALDGSSVDIVAVAGGDYLGVGYRPDLFCGDYPVTASEKAVADHRAQYESGDLTSTLTAFASAIAAAPAVGSSACSAYLGNSPDGDSSGNGGGWIFLLILFAVLVVAVVGFAIYGRRSKAKSAAVAKEKVMPYYNRLAQEILGFDTKDDDEALKAIADASEKYSLANDQIERASTVEDWAVARVTVLEGLNASRLARLALGMDEGEPIPEIAPPAGDQLAAPQEVSVQGETFQGYPQYTPGSSHYYNGGNGVPGGWYSTPFWERLLIGGMFGGGGGFGGGVGGVGGPFGQGQQRRRGGRGGGWTSGRSSRGGWSSGGRGSGGGRGGGWSSGGRG